MPMKEQECIARAKDYLDDLVSMVARNPSNASIEAALHDLERILLGAGVLAQIGGAFNGVKLDRKLGFVTWVKRQAEPRLRAIFGAAEANAELFRETPPEAH